MCVCEVCGSVVECLSSMCEVLGSIPSTGREEGRRYSEDDNIVSCSWAQTWPLSSHRSLIICSLLEIPYSETDLG